MRFLLSTVAATALVATPALAQQAEPEPYGQLEGSPGTQDRFSRIDFTELQQELSAAGFRDANELFGAEVYHSTYRGQQALIIVTDEDIGGVAAAPGDDEWDDDLAAEPDVDDPGSALAPEDDVLDDDLAAGPDLDGPDTTAGITEDDTINDDLAFDPDIDDPAVTATIPGQGLELGLGHAGFEAPRRATEGQVFRTTTEDGRTMLIVLSGDFGADPGLDTMDPAGADPMPEMGDELEDDIQ